MKFRFAKLWKAAVSTRALDPWRATRLLQAAMVRKMSSAKRKPLLRLGLLAKALPKPPKKRARAGKAPAALRSDETWASRRFQCSAGMREYKLHAPAKVADAPRGLIIMLHGCKQSPDDFASGTRMNAVAASNGLIVAYPSQTRADNVAGCWNWFRAGHQSRGRGEPAILAGIARELMAEFQLDRDQVFIAGLSAGGAMALIMAETYPDIFAAVGVHSGLPYKSANGAISALSTMRGNATMRLSPVVGSPPNDLQLRTIIFQGGADGTVHPSNAEAITQNAVSTGGYGKALIRKGAANGKRFTRSVVIGDDGRPAVESWTIEGGGHAWSGGSPDGTFSDPHGPDASAEMVRFFLEGVEIAS